ncbi:hypothetical protein IAU59_000722 [Kwoniella sp. CBS 9459]
MSLLLLAVFAILLGQANALTGCSCNGLSIASSGFNNGAYYSLARNIPTSLTNEGYCIVDDVMTTATANKINEGISNNVNTLYTDITSVSTWCYNNMKFTTRAQCSQYVQNIKRQQMIGNPNQLSSCTYPSSNFVPTDCRCNFECTNGYVKCGTSSCINPNTQTCVSGAPRTRAQRRSFGDCPEGLTACKLGSHAWECLDTSSDLEACGACPGEGGVDCSEIAGASHTSCQAGQCNVTRCLRGYSLVGGACVPVFVTARKH